MKQTVEEVAMQELMSSYAIVVEGELVYQRQAMLNMFRKGAEWQSRQSPWISVKERLPEQNELVLCRMVSNEAIVSGFIIPMPSGRPRVVTLSDLNLKIMAITFVTCGHLFPPLMKYLKQTKMYWNGLRGKEIENE